MFSTATAVRVTGPTPFSANCLAVPAGATTYTNAEVEPHLAINPSNPNHLVAAWQQDRLSDGGARGLVTAVSVDGGTTWSRPQASPFTQCAGNSYARASDPWVAVSDSAVLQIGIAFSGSASTAGARSTVLVSRSGDGGTTWAPAIPLVDDDGSRYFHDKESLTIDSTDPRYVYALWDRVDPSDSGPTLLARSTDGGVSWSPAVSIYDPGIGRQTIGNVAVTTPDGVVHVFFTELGKVRQVEAVQGLAQHRHANEATAIHGHEGERLGRHELSRQAQIPFVFAVFIIYDHDETAAPVSRNRVRNTGEAHGSSTLFRSFSHD